MGQTSFSSRTCDATKQKQKKNGNSRKYQILTYLRPVFLDILLRALENELAILNVLAPGNLKLLLPCRRPLLVTLPLLQQRLWHRGNSGSSGGRRDVHLHLITTLRHRCGKTTGTVKVSHASTKSRTGDKAQQTKRNKTVCRLDRNRVPQTLTLISTAAISS